MRAWIEEKQILIGALIIVTGAIVYALAPVFV